MESTTTEKSASSLGPLIEAPKRSIGKSATHFARSLIVNLAKLSIVVVLLWWMMSTDRLHLSQLRIFVEEPTFLGFCILNWTVGALLAGSYRWFVLLRGIGLHPSFRQAITLTWIGFFFNASIPGSVGGDVIKAMYIVKQQPGRRTAAALTVLLDRIIGLMGLFSIGAVSCLFYMDKLINNPITKPLVLLTGVAMIGIVVFMGIVFLPFKTDRDPIVKILSKSFPGASFLLKIYEALRAYRDCPSALFTGWLISVSIQLLSMLFFFYTTIVLTRQTVHFGEFAVIFPFGTLATAIPLAPGGMGVGHVAFDKLFALIGLTGGANVFNVILIATLILNLTGVIPYLLFRAKKTA